MNQLTIVADVNIPSVDKAFSTIGKVTLVDGRKLTSEQLLSADVLLVRSVTRVNEELLAGTPVKFVATATIGIDHLDIEYLEASGIQWASAPGCNANSVVDYVLSVFCRFDGVLGHALAGAVVGIIGMGNVGSRLYQRLQAMGIQCIAYDPLIEQNRYPVLTNLESVLKADILCLHTPLTISGNYPTYHMIGEEQLEQLATGTVLINAGRGEVVDNQALLAVLQRRHDLCVALDVWENEPNINIELMKRIDIATPHIAGYSLDGKLAGLEMIYRSCCEYLRIDSKINLSDFSDSAVKEFAVEYKDKVANLRSAVLKCYDVARDDQLLRGALLHCSDSERAALFDQLRKNYPERREFHRYRISNADELNTEDFNLFKAIGFLCS